jgi:hypothetical protein
MITVDRARIAAPPERVFGAAAEVERWPEILPHYRWVRFLPGGTGTAAAGRAGEPEAASDPGAGGESRLVEMAAWRPFGPLRYPTWWVSEMTVIPSAPAVRYRHVRGITRGMAVEWTFAYRDGAVDVTVTHRWAGPAWPLVARPVADLIIGPLFVHGVARRTLAGLKRHLEGRVAAR